MPPSPTAILYVSDSVPPLVELEAACCSIGLGASIAHVSSEGDYLAALEGGADLVFADLAARRLPVARALELLAQRSTTIPLIVLSDGATDEVAIDCMRRGATDYLRRPDRTTLAAALRRAIEDRRTALRAAERQAEAAIELKRLTALRELTADYAYSLRVRPQGGLEGDWAVGAFTRITGYTPEDVRDREAGLAIIHPEDRPAAIARLRSLLAGTPSTFEYRLIARDGSVHWARDTASPEWEGGRVVRVNGAVRDITEQKRNEIDLAAARRLRQNVMATVPDVIYLIDTKGQLREWNGQLERVTGLSEAELEGRLAADFFALEDRAVVEAAVMTGLATGYVQVEARMVMADGSLRPYQYTGVPLRDERGDIVGLTGVGRDITELQLAQRRTETLLEAARDVSGTLDLRVMLENVQRRTAELLRCDIVATFYLDADRGVFRAISHHGVPAEVVPLVESIEFPPAEPYVGPFAQGRSVVVRDAVEVSSLLSLPSGSLLTAPLRVQGRHIGALACFRQGSEEFAPEDTKLCEGIAAQLAVAVESADLYRVQQEDAQVSRALARVGSEIIGALNTPDLLDRLCRVTVEEMGCDSSHTLLHVPEEDAFLFVAGHGYPADEWEAVRAMRIQAHWFSNAALAESDAVRHVRREDLPRSPLRALADKSGISELLGAPLHSGRRLIGFLSTCYRHREPTGFTQVQRRIASGIAHLASLAVEHARAVDEVQRASRLKSEFVATMSHELRTPLNVILGYNELLLDDVFDPLTEKQREVLERSGHQARELLQLIVATLDLSRIEAGRMKVDIGDVALGPLLAEVETETAVTSENPAVKLDWESADNLPVVRTDALKVKVIVRNLVSNALKFTERGSVRVSARAAEDRVEIAVVDTGPGIDAATRDIMFEAFRQGDGSTTRRHGGVGLGLYTVRRLLDILGGDIVVESTLGAGSTFRVRLPLGTARSLAA